MLARNQASYSRWASTTKHGIGAASSLAIVCSPGMRDFGQSSSLSNKMMIPPHFG